MESYYEQQIQEWGMKPFGYVKIEIIHSHDLGEWTMIEGRFPPSWLYNLVSMN